MDIYFETEGVCNSLCEYEHSSIDMDVVSRFFIYLS